MPGKRNNTSLQATLLRVLFVAIAATAMVALIVFVLNHLFVESYFLAFSQNGQKLILAQTHPMARVMNSRIWHLFDGQYPAGWPGWLTLPDKSYLVYDSQIDVTARSQQSVATTSAQQTIWYKTFLIVQQSPGELLSHYQNVCDASQADYTVFSDGIWKVIDARQPSLACPMVIKITQLDQLHRDWSAMSFKVYPNGLPWAEPERSGDGEIADTQQN